MISHSYVTDTQTKATDLAATVLAAASPPQVAAACSAVEAFLQKHTPDQTRWFFSITFPTLICRAFGFDNNDSAYSSAPKPIAANGWIDIATSSNDSELAGKLFQLFSPNGVLLSSISASDRLSLVKYVYPIERLPEWVRYMLQHERDCQVLADLCPLFKNRIMEDNIKGSSFQVQLNVFEYYMFWFAYYPVSRGNNEGPDVVNIQRNRKFKLENWTYSIPGLSSAKRGPEKKNEGNLYIRLLYAYLRYFVPVYDLDAHQPYRSSLLHYSSVYDTSVIEQAEFLVNTLIQFWLVDNDFSPLPVNVCKSFGLAFPFRTVLGETPPTSGLGEVINVFVKYLNLRPAAVSEEHDRIEYKYNGSPRRKFAGSADPVKSRDSLLTIQSPSSWNSWIKRPLYRYILRTFLFCPVETSIKNASQVFSLWISYIEPWTINLDEFAELDAKLGMSATHATNTVTQASAQEYSSCWEDFVLANYLYYSSLVMHFIGFSHKFLHTDAEVIVQMVFKVINILTSSTELMDLIKNMDTVFHSKAVGSSKPMINALYRFVPSIREQLQDWEDGLCESDADGSFLHENWNKDLRLFSEGEDGGQQLLQLFVLRAESELQAISGANLEQNFKCLDSLKSQLGCLFGSSIVKSPSERMPDATSCHHSRDDKFKPRSFGRSPVADIKYKGDWMKRPISSDEVAWLAKLLVRLSGWLNESLGLNKSDNTHRGPALSYVEVSGDDRPVDGPKDFMKTVLSSLLTWFVFICGATMKFLRSHGLRVNLRILASKKVVVMVLIIAMFSMVKRALADSKSICI